MTKDRSWLPNPLKAENDRLRAENESLKAEIARLNRAGAEISVYTCPVCKMKSYNPNDIANKYCGMCNRFEGQGSLHLPNIAKLAEGNEE